jgi:RimJ/RimL family protein N-acetyltransferase
MSERTRRSHQQLRGRRSRVHLVIRETTLDDLPILFEHQRDPIASEMAVFEPRDWDAFVAHEAKIRADPTLIRRTVVVDDEVVGSIGCFGDEQREVGYWYDRAVWGKGIATAALAAFLDQVTERPLFAHVAVSNIGSAKVLERCGFVEVHRETTGIEEIVYRLS